MNHGHGDATDAWKDHNSAKIRNELRTVLRVTVDPDEAEHVGDLIAATMRLNEIRGTIQTTAPVGEEEQ